MQMLTRTQKPATIEAVLFPSEKILLAIGVICLCTSALLFQLELNPQNPLTAQLSTPQLEGLAAAPSQAVRR